MGGKVTRPAVEELAREFERNTVFGCMRAEELYRRWLEAVWALLHAVHDPQGYRTCLDRYTPAEGQEFGRLFGLYVDAVEEEPFRDILGQLFMRLDIRSARAGQCFTPWNIALMMARMQFDRADFERLVETKGVVTVCDPAAGSGVMLLAFARVVHDELGRWGTDKLRLYGQDIDIRCVHMCRIQFRMNGLDAFGRMARRGAVDLKLEPGQMLLPGLAA